MYVGLLLAIVGQALLFGNARLLMYAVAARVAPAALVLWYEESTLARQFADEYKAFGLTVLAWLPRLRPWEPPRR